MQPPTSFLQTMEEYVRDAPLASRNQVWNFYEPIIDRTSHSSILSMYLQNQNATYSMEDFELGNNYVARQSFLMIQLTLRSLLALLHIPPWRHFYDIFVYL
jgi:hypothetical protein